MKAFSIIADIVVTVSLLITIVFIGEARTDLWEVGLVFIFLFLLVFVLFCIFATIHAFKRKK